MGEKLFDEIPSLDLKDFVSGTPEAKSKFVTDLGEAYTNIGFVALKNHGLSDELTQNLYESVQHFFSLSDEIKSKYEIPELFGQRGYVGKGKEHAKGRAIGDLKEFYHIGQEVTDGDEIRNTYPENIWPEEIVEFQETTLEAYRVLELCGQQVLRAISCYLDLEESYFEDKVHNGNSILRPIHYFPILDSELVPSDAVRAAEHGDINLITLLMGASADGLQVLRKDGRWISITALPEQIIVNVGDMLARLTNDKLKSTIHRVINPEKEFMNVSRYSIPFFMHSRADMDLSCLSNCVNQEHPKQFEDITAGEFLHQRLEEIGLKG